MTERKRRKWDVAAPQGIPLGGNRAGTGAGSSASAAGLAGFVTPQGVNAGQMVAAAALPKPAMTPSKPGQPLDPETIARAQQGAAAIVAKLNQELQAQGKLPQGKPGLFKKAEDEQTGVYRHVVINDAPPDMRHHLTKRPTQDDIARRTGTQIVTRGRYMPPGTPQTDTDRPLYLNITPGVCASEGEAEMRRCVDAAAAEVQAILQGQRLPKGPIYQPPSQRGYNAVGPSPQMYNLGQSTNPVPYPAQPGPYPAQAVAATGPYGVASPGGQQLPAAMSGVQSSRLFLGFEPVAEFRVVERLRGPDESYLKHIAQQTGASISVLGRGSGQQENEPLHIFISSPVQKAFADAVKLAQSLLDTIKDEHAKQFPHAPLSAPPYSGGGVPPPAAGVPAGYSQPPYSGYGAAPGYGPPASGYPPPHMYPPGVASGYAPPAGGPGPPGYGAYPGMQPYGPPPGYGQPRAYGQNAGYGPGAGQQHVLPPGSAYSYLQNPNSLASSALQQPVASQSSPYSTPLPKNVSPGAGSFPPASQPPHAQPQLQLQPQHEEAYQAQQSEQQRRKRFREFKEEKPAGQTMLQPPPYYAPSPDVRSARDPESTGSAGGSMGPPPPKPAPMGPPPPRMQSNGGFAPMGPPPPRQPRNPAGGMTASAGEAGVFGNLVDYGEDD